MFAIEEEKFPPPTPAVAAHAIRTHSCVLCGWPCSQPLGTRIASSRAGISSSAALIVVHSRPPKRAIANVYGIRSADPTRLGIAVSRNWSHSDSVMPTFERLITTIVHSTQMLNPMCSAKIEKIKLRRAILAPVEAQNASFSGSQWSIHLAVVMARQPRRA